MADEQIGKESQALWTVRPIRYVLDLSEWMEEVQDLQKSPQGISHEF